MKLVFCPIDLDISITSLPEIRQHQSHEYNKFWDNEILLDDSGQWRSDLHSDMDPVKELVAKLPYTSLNYVRVSRQTGPVIAHKDIWPKQVSPEMYEHFVATEPCGYRIVLQGSTDVLEAHVDGKWCTTYLPTVPCCYVADTTAIHHRVQEDPNRIIIYVRGFVDVESHKKLIKRSLDRYSDYAVYSKG